jgi:hypothetical protein
MIQGGDGSGFAFEAFAEFLLGGFDRDGTVKPSITRSVHLTHAAGADRRKNFIRAEFVCRRKRHA